MPSNQRLVLIGLLVAICVVSAVVAVFSRDSGPYGPQFWIILVGGVCAVAAWIIQRRRGKK